MSDSKDSAEQGTSWFGFRQVASGEKASLVRGVFSSVAGRYDLMNDVMSAGVHRIWKSAMIDALAPRGGMTVLDVAGGTGDIALRITKRAPEAKVVIVDLTEAMVARGRDRAIDQGVQDRLLASVGDAQALPLPDRSVDAYTIAFGLRNVTDIDLALREARRVLKPGGRFLCLEFSRVVLPGLAELYETYSFRVLPWFGQVIARDRPAYEYLVESIRRFPPQEELVERMRAAGLARAGFRNLSGGIAALHSAWRV